MGYTTEFSGQFDIDRPLSPEHKAYLAAFADTRRMQRNPDITATLPDPLRLAVNLPVGEEGAYYVGGDSESNFRGGRTHDILDLNQPPLGQPGLWCQWVPDESGTAIVWDEGEKFYYYVEWIAYLIDHFLKPWGYVLNGEVNWTGEDESDDRGVIVIRNNEVFTRTGQFIYGDEEPFE